MGLQKRVVILLLLPESTPKVGDRVLEAPSGFSYEYSGSGSGLALEP